MDSEDFLLKWNDHHTLFFRGAEELLEKDEYTDVILAAGSKFYSAHKLVLSICSPFFQNVFKQLGHHNQKTVIYMKDIEPEHLELLLEYMYKGEIKVQENELVNVLSSAQSLEVRGLTDNSSSQSQNSKNTNLKESKTQRVTSDLLPASSGGGYKRSASNSSISTSASKRTKDTSPAKKSNYTAAAKSQKSPVVATSKGIKKEKTIATIKESRALNDAENISEEWPAVGEFVSGGEDSFVEDGVNTTAGGGGVREKAASAVDPTEYDAYENIGYEEDGEYMGDNLAAAVGPVQIIPGTTDGEDREPETLSVKPDLSDLHEQLSMKPDLADLELTVKPDLTDLEPLRAGCPGSIPKYWCKFCGKSFEFPSALRKHIVVHTREKPWKCEFCGQAFSQKSSLPKHQRSSCKKLKDPANSATTTPIKAEQIDAECTPWLGGSSDTSNSGHATAAGADTWTDPVKGHWLLDTANTDEDDDNSKSIHEDTPAPTPPIDTSAA